ncbi:type I restriction endonuclease [Tepidibacter mesophilus]|uniref:type I restriction endonuclease n=1 Tax=Tepidibacter mesophilus TaxID=655607 RepID=UPI000C07A4C0|nr:type I restriction endonuclease [Tepidibacter mesophilus]
MDFIDQLRQFSKRVDSIKENLSTEEATKTSIIMPFFQLLGYDVFNPQEFLPEYTADVGIKKGEKVDYAIMREGKPVILVEAKWIGESLEKHDSQLFRYFTTTEAKFAILTNGIIYRFYTDLEETNKMDEIPFLEINMLDIKESYVNELKKFHKDNFNEREIFDSASELKYSNEIKNIMARQLSNPTDDFVRFMISEVYSGIKTQNVIDKFRGIVKKSLNQYINELMNDRIKFALENDVGSKGEEEKDSSNTKEEVLSTNDEKTNSKVVTTEEELEGFLIIKNILREYVDVSEITYKDTESYFGILYKNNVRKWICRLYLNTTKKSILIPDENKKENRYYIETLDDIYKYKELLIESLNRYIETVKA